MKLDIVALGWDTPFREGYRPCDRQDHRPARVARVDRAVYSLLTAEGPARAGLGGALLAQVARDPLAAPCTGDWVALRSWPDQRTTIEAVLPRRTRIVRAAAGGQSHGQVLAANVDYAAGVEAMEPGPNPARVQRLLPLGLGARAQPLADIDALAVACRFDDCRHESEPGCAVRGALANGDLSARRLESWRRLRRELTWQGRRGTQIRRRYEHRRAAGRPPRSAG